MQSPRDLRLGVPTAQGTCITCPLALVRDSRPHWQGRTWHPVPKLVLCSIRRADRVGAEKEETGFRRWPERQLEVVRGCGQTSCRLHLHCFSWGLRLAVRTHPAAFTAGPKCGGSNPQAGDCHTHTHTHRSSLRWDQCKPCVLHLFLNCFKGLSLVRVPTVVTGDWFTPHPFLAAFPALLTTPLPSWGYRPNKLFACDSSSRSHLPKEPKQRQMDDFYCVYSESLFTCFPRIEMETIRESARYLSF